MNVRPELTIVVPTKNRQATAVRTIAQATSVGSAGEVEIVVHDCSDDASLGESLAAAGLRDRVRYVHTDEKPSMTENWNRAMAYVRGEYVMVIGDDDAVGVDVLAVVRAARSAGLEVIKARQSATFWHPDFNDVRVAGKLAVPAFTGAVEVVESEPVLRRNARTGDEYLQLPLAYHGLISKALLDRIQQRTGQYFHGYAPDVYSGYAIACAVERFGMVDYPLSLIGASGRSNTARQNAGTMHLHYAEFGDYPPTWLVPDSIRYEANLADNMVRALEQLGRHDLLANIEVTRIFARTIVAEPRSATAHIRKYIRAGHRLGRSAFVEVPKLFAFIAAKVALNAARALRSESPASGYELIAGVEDVHAAIAALNGWIAAHGVRLQAFA